MRWVARRYLADGTTVCRLEVALVPTKYISLYYMPAILDTVDAALSGEVEVRTEDAGWERAALIRSGAPFKRLLLRSTTRVTGPSFTPDAGWLRDGSPIAVVEYEDASWTAPDDTRVDVPGLKAAGLTLTYVDREILGTFPGVWLVGMADQCDRDALRRIRIHLLRIHAERECLKAVFRAVAGDLEVTEETRDILEHYFNGAINKLQRDSFYGIPQAEIFEAAYAADDLVNEGERASLLEALDGARLNIRRKVERATEGGGSGFIV